MKKIALMLAAVLVVLLFAACGKPASTADSAASANLEGTLEEIMEKLYEGIPEDQLPMLANTPITEENAEYMVGVTADNFKEGLSSDAMISAVAHSVCLLRAESAEAAEELAKQVEEKADPRKWICVEAEEKIVDRIGDVVVLIMASSENAEAIDANFKALAE